MSPPLTGTIVFESRSAQPKYGYTCLKWQLGISLMGDIIMWSGPHLGIAADSTIWEQTWDEHPFYGWERWLADLGYVGCMGLLYKYKRNGGRQLNRALRCTLTICMNSYATASRMWCHSSNGTGSSKRVHFRGRWIT